MEKYIIKQRSWATHNGTYIEFNEGDIVEYNRASINPLYSLINYNGIVYMIKNDDITTIKEYRKEKLKKLSLYEY